MVGLVEFVARRLYEAALMSGEMGGVPPSESVAGLIDKNWGVFADVSGLVVRSFGEWLITEGGCDGQQDGLGQGEAG